MIKDLLVTIEKLEDRKRRLELFKSEFNISFKNNSKNNIDNQKLIDAGNNQLNLIYDFNKKSFLFVDEYQSNNNDISIPAKHLLGGINNCNIFINRFLSQIKITLISHHIQLKRQQKK
jgi:hypothetical protein